MGNAQPVRVLTGPRQRRPGRHPTPQRPTPAWANDPGFAKAPEQEPVTPVAPPVIPSAVPGVAAARITRAHLDQANQTATQPVQQGSRNFTIDRSLGKDLPVQEKANRVNRVVSSYAATNTRERHVGNQWFRGAHNAARTIANGDEPGIGLPDASDYSSRHVPLKPGVTAKDVNNAAGAISGASPSMPAGMTWKDNPQAVHEIRRLTDDEVTQINTGLTQEARRAPLKGGISMQHARSDTVAPTRAMLAGKLDPEEYLNTKARPGGKAGRIPDRKKVGSFYHCIGDPKCNEVPVDFRAGYIVAGKRISSKNAAIDLGKLQGSRYLDYEGAWQEGTHIINQHLDQADRAAQTGAAAQKQRAARSQVAGSRPPAAGRSARPGSLVPGQAKIRRKPTPLLPNQVMASTWVAEEDAVAKLPRGQGANAPKTKFPTPIGQDRTYSA